MKPNPSACCVTGACGCEVGDIVTMRLEPHIHDAYPPETPIPSGIYVEVPLYYKLDEWTGPQGAWYADRESAGWPFDPNLGGGGFYFYPSCSYQIHLNSVMSFNGNEHAIGWPDSAEIADLLELTCAPFKHVSGSNASLQLVDLSNDSFFLGELKIKIT